MRRLPSLAIPLAILFLSVLPTPTLAQEGPPPGLDALNWMVGEWTYEMGEATGTMKAERFGDELVFIRETETNAAGTLVR